MAKQDQKLDQKLDKVIALLGELLEQVRTIASKPKETDSLGELKPAPSTTEPIATTSPAPSETGSGPLEKKPWSAIPSPRTETEPKKETPPLPPAEVYDPFKEKEP